MKPMSCISFGLADGNFYQKFNFVYMNVTDADWYMKVIKTN